MNVALAIQFLHRIAALIGEPVPVMDGDGHLLVEQRKRMSSLIHLLAGQCVDRDLEIALEQPGTQVFGAGVA